MPYNAHLIRIMAFVAQLNGVGLQGPPVFSYLFVSMYTDLIVSRKSEIICIILRSLYMNSVPPPPPIQGQDTHIDGFFKFTQNLSKLYLSDLML